LPSGQSTGAFEFVTRHDDRRPRRGRSAEYTIEFVATVGVESGVWFVEEPQFGSPGDESGQCRATTLTG